MCENAHRERYFSSTFAREYQNAEAGYINII